MNDLAGMLYDSLQAKIIPLEDDVIVYPAHGPGSSCGKNLGPNTESTIGEEKKNNYALKAANKEIFIKEVTEGITAPPSYFPVNARINKEGYESLDAVLMQGLRAFSPAEFKQLMTAHDTIILDTRHADIFIRGFIPGSVFIGLEGRFAEWAGSLLPFDAPILLITEPGMEKETIIRLARVGFSTVQGYLEGGYTAWENAGEATDMIIDVEADELMMDIPHDKNLLVVDVRRPAEFADGHLKDALNLPLNDLTDPAMIANLDEDQNLYVHCAGGYRSIIAASLLKRQGLHNLRNITGGWGKIKEQERAEIVKESSVLN
jgi:hydroxyacylglutathione hydrolase